MSKRWWYHLAIWNNCEFNIVARNQPPGVCQFWGKYKAYHKYRWSLDYLNVSVSTWLIWKLHYGYLWREFIYLIITICYDTILFIIIYINFRYLYVSNVVEFTSYFEWLNPTTKHKLIWLNFWFFSFDVKDMPHDSFSGSIKLVQ